VEALAAAARRIEAGDYRPPPAISGHNELGQLSAALASMVQAVSQREAALTAAVADREAARDAALRANEAKSQFLANMSHELRTPLNAVIGFAEMMRAQILGPLGAPRYCEYAEHVVVSGRHLLALVEDMLDLSKVEAGKLSIRRETLALAPLLEASLTMLRPLAEGEQVQLEVAGDFRRWPPIEGDPVKIKQVLVNIIGNAIKFTQAGGRVTITGELRQDALCVRITDTGIGMRAEDIPLVFKPFHRLQEAFDARHQGAGLGLPLAKAVVELHGGSLAIESALGKGTRVTITLPRSAHSASAIWRAGL
jgi:two-component system cell cycle sensor histidine kinase PleC